MNIKNLGRDSRERYKQSSSSQADSATAEALAELGKTVVKAVIVGNQRRVR